MFVDRKTLAEVYQNDNYRLIKPKDLLNRIETRGYYEAMEIAFNLARSRIGEKITTVLLADFQKIIGKNIKRSKLRGGILPHYQLSPNSFEMKAIKELIDSRILSDPQTMFQKISNGKNMVDDACHVNLIEDVKHLYSSLITERQGKKLIKPIYHDDTKPEQKILEAVNYYYDQIYQIQTLKGKISAIVELLRSLKVGHFFTSANQQLYAFIMLNKLLIENNIPPAILEDSSIFNGWTSLESMVNEVFKGVANFLNNNTEMQRSFLNKDCPDLISSDTYFGTSDYYPIYEKDLDGEVAKIIRCRLINQIRDSIDKDRINHLDELSLTPLSKAIILANIDIVDELLSKNAETVSYEYLDSSIFFLANYFNYPIAKKVFSKFIMGLSLISYEDMDGTFRILFLASQRIGIQMQKCLEMLVYSRAAYFYELADKPLSDLIKLKVQERFLDDSILPANSSELKELIQKCRNVGFFIEQHKGDQGRISQFITSTFSTLILDLQEHDILS